MSTNKKILSSAPLTTRPLRLRVETQSEDVRIEVVPLIDVIFCILTFFLLAAVGLSRQQAISVDLPKASSGTPQGRQILMVGLNELGQIYVDKQPMATKEQFLQSLQAYRQKSPEGLMALYASTNASYSQVVQVLDMLRQVGGERVALATLPGEAQQSSNASPAVPPTTGVPSYTPYPGVNPYDPYGLQNPANPVNPAQPQVPTNPTQPLPGVPGGINPGSPPPLPGQSGVNPGNSAAPNPGAKLSPKTNTAPGNSTTPNTGTQVSPKTPTVPGNSAAPNPGTLVSPKTPTVPGNPTVPNFGTQVSPKANIAPQD